MKRLTKIELNPINLVKEIKFNNTVTDNQPIDIAILSYMATSSISLRASLPLLKTVIIYTRSQIISNISTSHSNIIIYTSQNSLQKQSHSKHLLLTIVPNLSSKKVYNTINNVISIFKFL